MGPAGKIWMELEDQMAAMHQCELLKGSYCVRRRMSPLGCGKCILKGSGHRVYNLLSTGPGAKVLFVWNVQVFCKFDFFFFKSIEGGRFH